MDTEKCLANKPGNEEWYPIAEGFCTNQRPPPKNIYLSETSLECCNRFFSYSEDCIDKSNNPMSQFGEEVNSAPCLSLTKRKQCNRDSLCFWDESLDTCSAKASYESNVCHLLIKRQCKQDNSCRWDDSTGCSVISETAHPSLRPSNQSILTNESTTCQSLKNKRQCNQFDSCSWDEDGSTCYAHTSSATDPPSTTPTSKPSNQSIVSNESTPCKYFKNKRQCNQDSSCNWIEDKDVCEPKIDDNMTPNSAAVCSSGQCSDFKGDCQYEYKCIIDPCEVKSCSDNEICESNYCGGCTARCVENVMAQNSASLSRSPTSKPSRKPTARPSEITKPSSSSSSVAAEIEKVLEGSKDGIDNNILLYQTPNYEWVPSTVYRYNDFLSALRVMYMDGIANKHFYMGDDSPNGYKYGLVNIAAFLAQR